MAGTVPPERRVAIVFGNSAYRKANKLDNAAGDAVALADALRRLGFRCGPAILDADWNRLDDAITAFYADIEGADIALLFYAGHSVQVDDSNYLLPVDADVRTRRSLRRHAFELEQLIEPMKRKAQTSLVFLDACRDDPFGGEFLAGEDDTSRAITVPRRGPASVNLGSEGDVGIFFATSEGQTAADSYPLDGGTSDHSPFSQAILSHIEQSGLTFQQFATRVTKTVRDLTPQRQKPWLLSSISTEVVLRPLPPEPAPPEPSRMPEARGNDSSKFLRDTISPPIVVPIGEEAAKAAFEEARIGYENRQRLLDREIVTPYRGRMPGEASKDAGPSRFGMRHTAWIAMLVLVSLPAMFWGFSEYLSRPDTSVHPAFKLVERIGLLDDGDAAMADGVAAAIRASFDDAIGDDAAVDRDLVLALAEMAQDASLRSLGDGGQRRLFAALAQVPAGAWKQPEWRAVRGYARRALRDFRDRAPKADAGLQALLASLGDALSLPAAPDYRCANVPCDVFPQNNTLAPSDASLIQTDLRSLGWKIEANDSKPNAAGLHEVRYNLPGNADEASLLAGDLIALGFPAETAPARNPTIGSGKLEIWMGFSPADWDTAKPTAAWCYQQNTGKGGADGFLTACHRAKDRCETALQNVPKTGVTGCWFVSGISGDLWRNASPGGFLDSWYQYAPSPLAKPFPQLPGH